MIRFVALLFLVAALSVSAHAAKITVTAEECARAVAHVPDASVAYQPGVDVHGNQVAGANLPGSSININPPTEFTIDLKMDVAEKLGRTDPASKYLGEAVLGQVQIKNGRAYINGQELPTGAQHAVVEACKKLEK